jgi:hypothetical protein
MPEIEIHYPDGLVGYKPLSLDAPLVVGSATGCDIQIDAANIAKKHFLFRWSNSGNSWRFDVGKEFDGVQLNGRSSKGDALNADDEISLGDHTFIFRDSNAPRPAAVQDVQAYRPVSMTNYEEKDYYTPLLQQKTFRTILITIVSVVIIGGVSYVGFHATRADKLYNAAKKNLDDKGYEKAANEFKAFREEYPSDRRNAKAKLFRDVANIQALIQNGQQYGAAFAAADKTLKENEKSPAIRDQEVVPAMIDALVIAAQGAADKAKDIRSKIDTESLNVAKAALGLAERVGPREGELATRFDAAVEAAGKAAAAIEKETERRNAIDRMQKALDAKTPMSVYLEHSRLYNKYPDLKLDAEALKKRADARGIEQAMTVFKPAAPGTTAPAPAAAPANARPPITRTALSESAPSNRLVVIQAADALFGVDSGSGDVKWSAPVGFDPAFSPVAMEGGTLVHRTRDNALVMIEPADGKEKWVAPLVGKKLRFISRPLSYQQRIYLSGYDDKDDKFGRLFVFAQGDGKFLGEITFPQPLAGMPVLDSKRRTLLIPGDQATMYAINPGNNQCTAVYQMGHEPGTLAWVPMMPGRFLFAIENNAPGKSTLRVFVLSGEDGSLRERVIDKELSQLPGSVRRDPILEGTRLFVTTDRDAFEAFDLAGEEDERPIQLAAKSIPPVAVKAAPDAPYPITAKGKDRELWTIGNVAQFYQLRGGAAEAKPTVKLELGGPAAIPPILDGENLIVGSRVADGKVSIQCIDTVSQKPKWRLDLVQRPMAIKTDPSNKNAVVISLASGGTLSVPVADMGKVEPLVLPAGQADRVVEDEVNFNDIPGWSEGVVQWAGVGRSEFRSFPRGKPAKKFSLTSPAAAMPGPFGKGIIVPCQDGMVYWIDPATGADLADPFGVSFVDGKPVDLGTGVGVSDTAAIVIAGTSLIRLQLETKGYPHFREQNRVEIPDAPDTLKVDPAIVRRWLSSVQMARIGDRVLVAAGKNVYRLKTDDLTVEKTIPLGGNVPNPPTLLGGVAVFTTDRRELVAFGSTDPKQPADLRWRLKLDRSPLGPPRTEDPASFWLAYADGKIIEHASADGKPKRELNAGRNLLDGPWFAADRLIVVTPVGGMAALEVR